MTYRTARQIRIRKAQRLAMASIVMTFVSFALLFATAYFHDMGQSAPEALAAGMGCLVSFAVAFCLLIAAQEELTT